MMWFFGKKPGRQSVTVKCEGRVVDIHELGSIHIQVSIDCRGAVCPRPQMLTMKALDQMQEGEVVELLVDNPGSAEAIPAMTLTLGSFHLATIRETDYWSIYLRKGAADSTGQI